MRTSIAAMAALLSIALFIVSCGKDATIDTAQNDTTSGDLTTLQSISDDVEDEINVQIEDRTTPPNCGTRTVTPDDGTFPKTITVDYGTEGCEGPHGRIFKGQIIIEISDSLHLSGSTKVVSFVDFSVDDVQIEGGRTFTNNSTDARSISRTADITLTFPDGETATWSHEHSKTQIGGIDTDTHNDNVYEITGFSSGTNREGNAFSSEITTPLIKSRDCRWIESGVQTITRAEETRTIDYGDGTCDNLAEVTLPDGTTKIIRIRRWWR